jgi:hypothetical protein
LGTLRLSWQLVVESKIWQDTHLMLRGNRSQDVLIHITRLETDFNMLAAIAEFETELRSERQLDGINNWSLD